MASTADVQAGRAFVRLFLKNDMSSQLVRALRKAQAKLRQFGQSAMMTGTRVAAVGLALAAPFAFATRTFASFDDEMLTVAAVTQAVGADFDRLTDKAKQLGASTSFTAQQVAAGMVALGRAKFDPQQIDVASEHILALARATGTELADAARIAGGAMNGFSMTAEEMQRITDVQTYTVNNSAQTLDDYGEGLKMVAKIAKEAGAEIEDVSSMSAMLADNTIVGTMAGTAMARAYKNLASTKVDGMLQRLNVSAEDADRNMRPLSAILEDIGKATADMGSRERLGIFESLFGRGSIAAITLAEPSAKLRDFRAELDNVAGTALDTAAKMDSGLGGAFRILKSAAEGVQIAIGEALAPQLKMVSEFLTTAAQSTIKWITANKGVVFAVAATAAGLVAAGVALVSLGVSAFAVSAGLGVLATVAGGVFAVFRGVGNTLMRPFRLLGAAANKAAGVMRIAGTVAVASFRGIVAGAARAGVAVGGYLGPRLVGGVSTAFQQISLVAQATFGRLGQYAQAAGPLITTPLRMAATRLAAMWQRASTWFAPLVASATTATAFIGTQLAVLGQRWNTMSTVVASRWQMAMGRVSAVVSPVAQRISSVWSAMAIKMQAASSRTTGAIAAAYAKLPLWVRGPMQKMTLMVRADAGKIGAALSGAFSRVPVMARAAAGATAMAFRSVGPVVASGLVSSMAGAFARIRAMGAMTGRGLRGVRGLGGAFVGLAGAGAMLGAMGFGGKLAPILMMAPLAIGLIGSLGTAVAALFSPFGLLAVAAVGIGVAFVKGTDSGKRAWASLKALVLPIIGGIKDAIMAGEWGLAGQIAMVGLKLAVLQGLAAIQSAFPGTFNAILGITGMALDGLVAMFGIAIDGLKSLWNSWGQYVLDVVVNVAGAVLGTWQKAVSGMANSMLEISAGGGVMGKAMSKILGVDMEAEQKKSDRLDKELGLGPTDLLADAKDDIKRITEQWEAEAKAGLASSAEAADSLMQGLPDGLTTDIEGALERFASSLASGKNVEDASQELADLRGEVANRKAEKAKKAKESSAGGPAGGPAGGGPSVGDAATSAVPSGVALTATYSAQAASISGYQPTGGGPEEKMATGITGINGNTKLMVTKMGELVADMSNLVAGNRSIQAVGERFLAGGKVGG